MLNPGEGGYVYQAGHYIRILNSTVTNCKYNLGTVSSLSSAGSTKSGGVKKKRKKNKNDKSYGSQKSSP